VHRKYAALPEREFAEEMFEIGQFFNAYEQFSWLTEI